MKNVIEHIESGKLSKFADEVKARLSEKKELAVESQKIAMADTFFGKINESVEDEGYDEEEENFDVDTDPSEFDENDMTDLESSIWDDDDVLGEDIELTEEELDELASTGLFEAYGVYRKGGSVGEKKSTDPIKVHDNHEDAKAHAKRMNKQLSPGEKKHYGIKYHVKPIKEENDVELTEEELALIDELSRKTLSSYVKKAGKSQTDMFYKSVSKKASSNAYHDDAKNSKTPEGRKFSSDLSAAHRKEANRLDNKVAKRKEGISRAEKRLTKED